MTLNDLSKYQTIWVKDVPNRVLRIFWQELVESNVSRVTFYDAMIKDENEFCEWAKQNNKTLRFIVSKDFKMQTLKEITKVNLSMYFRAMYWLNNQVGKCYMIHFAYLKSAFYEQEDVGKYVVHGLLKTKNSQGEFVIDALLGLTPCVYRHALNFIKKLGFCFMGIVPNACFFEKKNSYKDGMMSLLTRNYLKD